MAEEFEFTIVASENAANDIDIATVEDKVNNSLSLSAYGPGLKKVFCTFLLVPIDNSFHQNQIHFRVEDKCLEVAVRVNAPALDEISEATLLHSLSSLLSEWLTSADFNKEQFIQDLKELSQA